MTERPSFLAELKRRNVFRVAIAYAAVSWLVLEVGALIFQALDLPNVVLRSLLALLIVGFIPALVFSWVYELTPDGLKRARDIAREESITHLTGRKLDYLVFGVMAVVIGLLLLDKFMLSPRHAEKAAEKASESLSVSTSAPAAATETTERGPGPVSAAPLSGPPEASIAVLPFVNMSSDKEQEYFSDGISEELLNLLAKITQLHVAARTSSFSFKGKDVPIPEIAKTLRVAHVLEGSVRKSGEEVRITAQLIRAADGYHLWSHTYDRKLDDIFAIQDEIAADVVKQLKVTLLGAVPTARQTDPEAFALYLQARQLSYQGTADSYRQSDALLRQALAIDPGYAPAWDELARNFLNEASSGAIPNDQGIRQAREAAEKALAIDPDYAPAHARLGRVASAQRDVAGAARHIGRAQALDPSDLDVLRECAVLLQRLGRLQQAIAVNEHVVSRDPVNARSLFNLGITYRFAGRHDDAIATFRTVLSLNPSRGAVHYHIGTALQFKGDAAGALAEMEQETSGIWRSIGLPMAYHAHGRKAESDEALAALIASYGKDTSYNIAYVHAFRGDADQTFEWLATAVQLGDSGLAEIAVENLFDNIHEDPRWLPFLRSIGNAPEQLAAIRFVVMLPAEPQAGKRAP